jgi:hypothetical protein
MNDKIAVGISFQNDVPASIIDEFQIAIDDVGLRTESKSHDPRIYASFEWAIPTAVVVYLARPFFDAFLSEAGKDVYDAFKKGSLLLIARLLGSKPENRETRRSLLFSLQFHDRKGRSIKCIIPEGMSGDGYVSMLEELHPLIADNLNNQEDDRLDDIISSVRSSGKVFFIEYSPDQKTWVIVDTNAEIQSRKDND